MESESLIEWGLEIPRDYLDEEEGILLWNIYLYLNLKKNRILLFRWYAASDSR